MTILCVCLSAAIQRTLSFDDFEKGAVNRTSVFREDAGGKALNAARVLNQIERGCARALCPVGTENAARFLELARRDGIDVVAVPVPGNVRDCWTLLSRGGSTTEVVADEHLELAAERAKQIERELLSQFAHEIESCDALLLAGSTPAHFAPGTNQKLCECAKRAGKLILADFCGPPLRAALAEKTSVPDFVKINEEELLKTFTDGGAKKSETPELIASLSEKYGAAFIITRGKKATVASMGGTHFMCETEDVVPVNTTACGDSFSAGFLHEVMKSKKPGGVLAPSDFAAALRRGTFAAARNAENIIPGKI